MILNKIATSLITGTLMVAGAAFGATDTEHTRADIGFAFRTPAGVMPAGKYNVEVRSFQGGQRYIQLNNLETRKSSVFFVQSPVEANKPQGTKMVFQCGKGDCNLAQIWSAGSIGYQIRAPRLSAADAERLAVAVPLQTASSAE
ncbi:MAG TPA: hypothetical protein VES20_19225 [Bryobacteraceae bacterium]|nr:hypothetical protein [Bryobacteraceae bacterium]